MGEERAGLAGMVERGEYLDVLRTEAGKNAITEFVSYLDSAEDKAVAAPSSSHDDDSLLVALAALDAFLQINVTGPAIEGIPPFATDTGKLQKDCLRVLEVDGVAPYAYIPSLELFCLARRIILGAGAKEGRIGGSRVSLGWAKLRIHVWHYKLLTQPQLGGSTFSKSSQWSEVPSLVALILAAMEGVRKEVLDGEVWADAPSEWTTEEKAECALELANCDIMLGRDESAREGVKEAAGLSGFQYVLSGALGKRTKFQETSLSQLVVLAKSASAEVGESGAQPKALDLNDETLLEKIAFDKAQEDGSKAGTVPEALKDLAPDAQPQLVPLDQIALLTEATVKDAFSPPDDLTSEEVLPYAQRVLDDKATNWQIYTQALIVRSRVETHRSRTVERGVLQLQAVVDQVVVDTTPVAPTEPEAGVPAITLTEPSKDAPTSFFPAPKPDESAPASERLRYIHALSTPPRWHLESELAYGWASVGSLISALEIFKRLRLWAEVALCLASAEPSDESGRTGGEEKARGIIRWRLFNRTGADGSVSIDADDEDVPDVTRMKADDWKGPERSPPPNAPRLWCILGDLEDDPSHYERAWEISGSRYSRAQKSLAELYIQKNDYPAARDAYRKAVYVNRLSPDMWSRLGDIHLRLGEFSDAADAFGRAIGAASDVASGEDARTWSNMGSALYSMYCNALDAAVDAIRKGGDIGDEEEVTPAADEEEDEEPRHVAPKGEKDPEKLLAQSLNAYKRGAGLQRDNWRIWDNVLTIASRTIPPSLQDMIIATQNIIRIRNTEEALDAAVLSVLLREGVLSQERTPAAEGIHEPARGTVERAVVRLLEDDVVPLITKRSDLWELISRERIWRNDFAGGVDASERAWRAAVAALASADADAGEEGWATLVTRTDELVSLLENFGPDIEAIGERWRGKARNAVRSALGKGRGKWEGSEGWAALEGLMEGLKKESS
ncbi:related to TPR repeat-containing protein [Cephalotrichum gorgonifer]|uniref:Related to TPR repeat-containing protein n=1 Tax=Cephalotrichum gorgonifer TaxID=2041049 RepID=A0AAE8MWI4_9PEZI|nr:related to TPR repeat-containing protein [Cephalotrichum gorgonifer]